MKIIVIGRGIGCIKMNRVLKNDDGDYLAFYSSLSELKNFWAWLKDFELQQFGHPVYLSNFNCFSDSIVPRQVCKFSMTLERYLTI